MNSNPKTKKFLTILIFSLTFVSQSSIFAQRPQMILVTGGKFTMNIGDSNMNQIDVNVGSFMMSKYEVTFDDFDMFCEATGYQKPPDGGFGRGQLPAINISWEGAIMFCNWMSRRFNLDKVYEISYDSLAITVKSVHWENNGFRLPTVAEWQYAAGGGEKKEYTEDYISDYAWYKDNSDSKPHTVGTKKANNLGIYDMYGNAWEWCSDAYDKNYDYSQNTDNPRGSEKGNGHYYMGGDFKSKKESLLPSMKYHFSQIYSYGIIGIRLVQKVN